MQQAVTQTYAVCYTDMDRSPHRHQPIWMAEPEGVEEEVLQPDYRDQRRF